MPRTGGVPLRTRPEPRRTYHALELDRWRKYLGMPLELAPSTTRGRQAAGLEQAAGLDGDRRAGARAGRAALSHALLRALWAEERDTSDPAVRIAVADENGFRA